MLTPAKCRAARALLDWSQQKLAEEAGVGSVTVRQFEGHAAKPRRATMEVLVRAFVNAGIRFTAHGVELPPQAK
ncbi:helix-turn-helix transcriptional regulator [Tistrella bauzanensis]|uniref:helix-turn-helix domain-containing protein n=1 Tax=Tistrella TaxID=171436 RepID=UPI0031F6DCEA